MRIGKSLLLNFLSTVALASLLTACCSFPYNVDIRVDEGGEVSVSLVTPEPEAPVAAEPGPTEVAEEAVGIVSERELNTEEFLRLVDGDDTFEDAYALASEEGYAQPQTGGEFTLSDGSLIQALVLSSAADELAYAVRFWDTERTHSLLTRVDVENETILLYDRDGRAEISVRGISVYDAAGNVFGDREFPDRARGPGLTSTRQDCEGPGPYEFWWGDFKHCTRIVPGGGEDVSGCLATNLAAYAELVTASTPATPFTACQAVVRTLVDCQVPDRCVREAIYDDAPTYDLSGREQMARPCTVECVTLGEQTGTRTIQNYRFQVQVDDDRPPYPQSSHTVDVCAGESEILPILDCAGHQVDVPLQAPGPAEQDLSPCPDGETCIDEDTTAQCRPTRVETPPARTPPPSGGVTELRIGRDTPVTISVSTLCDNVNPCADLDLSMTDPAGCEVSKSRASCPSGARWEELEPDCEPYDALCFLSSPYEEVIHLAPEAAPSGEYRVFLRYSGTFEEDVEDAGPVDWDVLVQAGSKQEFIEVTISYLQRIHVITLRL